MKSLDRVTFLILMCCSVACTPVDDDNEVGLCPAIAAVDNLEVLFRKELVGEQALKIYINENLVFDECSETVDLGSLKEFDFYYSHSSSPKGYFDPSDNSSKPMAKLINVEIETASTCGDTFVNVVDETSSIEWTEFKAGCDVGFNGLVELAL